MPIVISFTITAACALVVNIWFWLRAYKRRAFLIHSKVDGELRLIADTFVRMWTIRLVSDILILTAGVGTLLHFRQAGYALAMVPVASTLIGLFALRGLLRKGGI